MKIRSDFLRETAAQMRISGAFGGVYVLLCAPCVPVWGMALYAARLRCVRRKSEQILAVLRAGCSPFAGAQGTAGQNGNRAGLLALARQIAQSVAVQFGIETLPRQAEDFGR